MKLSTNGGNMRVGNRPMTLTETMAAIAEEEQQRREEIDLVTSAGEFNQGIGNLLNCLLD